MNKLEMKAKMNNVTVWYAEDRCGLSLLLLSAGQMWQALRNVPA